MFQFIKIAFPILFLFIISCDKEAKSVNPDPILGCTNSLACNYDSNATENDNSCQLNLFCYDSDGDGLGYGDSTQICLDEVPNGWVLECSDLADDCVGIKDDCGECNGNNQNKDCNEICFGTSVLDDNQICCDNDRMQYFGELSACLPDTFKWSLKMIATMGDYNDNIFIPSVDSVLNHFTIGTHYLSTDGLDILEDMNYSDIVQPPSTVEQSIYLYTSHPEWEYQFGDNFIKDYKSHSMNSIIWDGYVSSDFYGQKYIKITFELESEQNIVSELDFSLNGIGNISSGYTAAYCELGYVFDNVYEEGFCSLTSPQFEYIVPIIFQGSGYLTPFSIEIFNLVVY